MRHEASSVKRYGVRMVTSVMRVGETAAIALDELLLELSGLKVGDAVRVQWNEDGTLVVTPLGRPASKQELAASIRRVSKPEH
jgi:antitoxin component of MazEF toxin-antitoxin module